MYFTTVYHGFNDLLSWDFDLIDISWLPIVDQTLPEVKNTNRQITMLHGLSKYDISWLYSW